MVNVNDTERYEGGNSENVALVIRSTDKQDIGNYTCQLSNSIGKGVSEQQIDLDVQCKYETFLQIVIDVRLTALTELFCNSKLILF